MTVGWKKIFEASHGESDGHDAIFAMTDFNGELYIVTTRFRMWNKEPPYHSAELHHLIQEPCKSWQNATSLWSPVDGPRYPKMLVFNNFLFVGTENGEIWRSNDGTTWIPSNGNLSAVQVSGLRSMVEFNNHLYICTGGCIYRTSDGVTWDTVVGPSPALHPYGFGLSFWVIYKLEVLNGYLYAGLGKAPNEGIQLWRTNNGVNWEIFHQVLPNPQQNVSVFPDVVFDLKTFSGHLYIAHSHGGGLFRTDGSIPPSPSHWEKISFIGIPNEEPFAFEVHEGKLYLALRTYPLSASQELSLCVSGDGIQWSTVQPPLPSLAATAISSLLSKGERLYVGTLNCNKTGSTMVWEISPEIDDDDLEPNNDFMDATIIDLEASPEKTAGFTNLTLLDDDVDFFQISFASQPGEGSASFKKELVGGIVALFVPSHLSISVREEYCGDLLFDIYDANQCLKGTFKNSVSFSSPSKSLNGQQLFVVVKHNPGLPPLRYHLCASYPDGYVSLSKPAFQVDETKEWPIYLNRLPEFFGKMFEESPQYFDPSDWIKNIEKYLPEFIKYRGKIDEANLKYGLGFIAHRIGELDKVERLYRSSLTSFRELEMATHEAEVLRNLGELLSDQGRVDEASECFERAFQLHEQAEEPLSLAYDLMAWGHHQLAIGEIFQSLTSLEKSLRFLATTPDMQGRVINLLYQSEAFAVLNMHEAAMACLVIAENIFLLIKDPGLWTELDDQMQNLQAKIGEKRLSRFRKDKKEQAEVIRYEAITKVLSPLQNQKE
jgi:tetratricopeptide (TPR) repeat protein